MNGRAYDYNLGRFLSVDPFIQAPSNSQSMNPYSYIMNNPLAGTDPSGYLSCNVDQTVGDCGLEAGGTADIVDDDGNKLGTASLSEDGKTLSTEGNNGVNSTITVENGKLVGSVTKSPENIGSQGQISIADNANDSGANSSTASGIMTHENGFAFGGSGDNFDDFEGSPDNQINNSGSRSQSGATPRITDEQRRLAEQGKRKEFWLSRQAVGDPMAEIALESIANEGKAFGGGAANRRLQAFARVYIGHELDLHEVGVAVMLAHVKAIDNDKLGDIGRLNPQQIAKYHHDVFRQYGLPETTFGGTPLTGSLTEATATRWIWCQGCEYN